MAQEELVQLQLPYLHGAASSRARDRADARQPRRALPREGAVAAVVSKGDLREDSVGGGGLPRDVGR